MVTPRLVDVHRDDSFGRRLEIGHKVELLAEIGEKGKLVVKVGDQRLELRIQRIIHSADKNLILRVGAPRDRKHEELIVVAAREPKTPGGLVGTLINERVVGLRRTELVKVNRRVGGQGLELLALLRVRDNARNRIRCPRHSK